MLSSPIRRSAVSVLALFLFAAGPENQKADIYDETADAAKAVAAAEKIAAADNSRVLLMVGGNWCGWCHKLHDLFKTNDDVKTALRGEFQVVNIDIGRGDKNQDLLKKYGIKPEGYPYLAVLDPVADKLLVQQETGALEEGDHHDPAKVVKFLNANKAPAQAAGPLLDTALSQAKASDKQVFLRFGAPWCGWCHKLDAVLRDPAVASALDSDLIVLKIDIDRTTGGKEIQKKYQSAGGIPWFAILSPDGKIIGNSELTPGNNIGFPTEPAEIDHVIKLLTTARKKMTDEQAHTLKAAFMAAAAKVNAASGAH